MSRRRDRDRAGSAGQRDRVAEREQRGVPPRRTSSLPSPPTMPPSDDPGRNLETGSGSPTSVSSSPESTVTSDSTTKIQMSAADERADLALDDRADGGAEHGRERRTRAAPGRRPRAPGRRAAATRRPRREPRQRHGSRPRRAQPRRSTSPTTLRPRASRARTRTRCGSARNVVMIVPCRNSLVTIRIPSTADEQRREARRLAERERRVLVVLGRPSRSRRTRPRRRR